MIGIKIIGIAEAAKKMGFSESEAELLVAQTFTGAVDLYNKADLSCENWIAKVASKGGTTEAALRVWSEKALHEEIIAGANAALDTTPYRVLALGPEIDWILPSYDSKFVVRPQWEFATRNAAQGATFWLGFVHMFGNIF